MAVETMLLKAMECSEKNRQFIFCERSVADETIGNMTISVEISAICSPFTWKKMLIIL